MQLNAYCNTNELEQRVDAVLKGQRIHDEIEGSLRRMVPELIIRVCGERRDCDTRGRAEEHMIRCMGASPHKRTRCRRCKRTVMIIGAGST